MAELHIKVKDTELCFLLNRLKKFGFTEACQYPSSV
jgi:hypothetical protein